MVHCPNYLWVIYEDSEFWWEHMAERSRQRVAGSCQGPKDNLSIAPQLKDHAFNIWDLGRRFSKPWQMMKRHPQSFIQLIICFRAI